MASHTSESTDLLAQNDQGETVKTTVIKPDMRVRLPEQLGSAEGVAMFMDGSRSNWAVYVPGPKHPGNDLNDGFLVYCPPEWLQAMDASAPDPR